jgi:hypothetical protein
LKSSPWFALASFFMFEWPEQSQEKCERFPLGIAKNKYLLPAGSNGGETPE